jgi:hypothetical protein
MHVQNLELEDYFNLPNAAADGDPPGPALGEVDATVSFDVVWTGPVTRLVSVRDAANGFAGEYAESQVTVTWSGREGPAALFPAGFRFRANPGSFATSVPEAGPFAELGRERNGVFFPGGGGSGGSASALLGATAPDGVGVGRAPADASAALATVRPALLPPALRIDALTATPVGNVQRLQPVVAPHRLVIAAAHSREFDPVFVGLDDGTFADAL